MSEQAANPATSSMEPDRFPPANPLPAHLRLHRCPGCGYDLTGLVRNGKCPECAFAYDEQMFSLLGFRPLPAGRLVLLAALMAGAGMALATGRGDVALPLLAATIAMMISVAPAAGPLIWSRSTRQPQWVLFTTEGVRLHDRPGMLPIVPWTGFRRVTFHRWRGVREQRSDRPTWRIALYREANPILFEAGSLAGRPFASVLHFQLQASEDEARAIVDELRRRFSRAWGIAQE